MRIGITCHLSPAGDLGLFAGGIRQTAIFLYRLLKKHGHDVKLLVGPGSGFASLRMAESFGIETQDVTESASVERVIVVSRSLGPDELEAYKIQGAKIILWQANSVLNTMGTICGPNNPGNGDNYSAVYDKIWVPSHISSTTRPWLETVYQVSVTVVPPVWEPLFLQPGFGFEQPADGKFELGVMEPNNSLLRTAHYPLMAIRFALQRSGDKIKKIHVTNAEPLRDASFQAFVDRLQIRDLTNFSPRLVGPQFVAHNVDLLVTHDLEQGLNHLTFECLYGGYPVVHCSPYLFHLGQGYHYGRFDIGNAGLQICKAIEGHDPEATKQSFVQHMMPQLQQHEFFEAAL